MIVRPWYDSDSLLRWLDAGVQLPPLGPELQEAGGKLAGLLRREDEARDAFDAEYGRQGGRCAGLVAWHDLQM